MDSAEQSIMRITGDRRGTTKRDFSKRMIEAIRPPATGRAWIYDAAQPGLCMMITPAGTKSFYLYRKVKGRPQRYRIGAYPAVTVEQARHECMRLLGRIVQGADPIAERRAIRDETTLGELWTTYIAEAKARKRSFAADISRWNNHVSKLAARRLSEITTPDVAAWHARLGQRETGRGKPGTSANRALALLSVLFNRARQLGYVGHNPCEKVQRFPEKSRGRFLKAEELPRFAEAVAAEPEDYRDLFHLCLFTGARVGNVRTMEWSEVDLDRQTWAIPPEKYKTGEAFVVTLGEHSIDILRRRRASARKDAKYVFPQHNNPRRPLGYPYKSWERIRKAAGLADVNIHDLRRTQGSWQAANGASLSVIGKSLGQSTQHVTAIYARLELDPVRASVTKANVAIAAAMKPREAKTEQKSPPPPATPPA